MTCAVAYRPRRRPDRKNANSQYAVLAVDGRITDEHGTIYTDRAVKWAQAGRLVCVFAGDVGPMQQAIQSLLEASPAKLETVQSTCRVMCAGGETGKPTEGGKSDAGWTALVYNSATHELFEVDSDGAVLRHDRRIAAIGTGSEVALGHLLACRPDGPNWSLSEAKLRARAAIKSSAARNSTVGPSATVLVVSPEGRVRVRG